MAPDQERLRKFFDRPGLKRLVERLLIRRDRGDSLNGVLTLDRVQSGERRAIDDILRRKTTTGAKMSVPLDLVLNQLIVARLADSWEEVLHALFGPPDPTRIIKALRTQAWDELWNRGAALPSKGFVSCIWFERLRRDGSLRRLSHDDPQRALTWITQAMELAALLPLESEPLASVAARVAGNSHALDPDQPLATLALRGIAAYLGVSGPQSAKERRALWAKVGILCDELSTPALTFNLTVANAAPLTEILVAARVGIVPIHVSTRLLLSTDWRSAIVPKRVFVCENSSLVALANQRLGSASQPLVCLDGEPKTAGWLLLDRLREAGAEFFYHGDFDWSGLAIARRVLSRIGAKPWRYSERDYLVAPGTEMLEGPEELSPWCPTLAMAMKKRGVAIHEEAVAEPLIQDLGENM
jgi:uncharacterized protein (TIGR02679 family)